MRVGRSVFCLCRIVKLVDNLRGFYCSMWPVSVSPCTVSGWRCVLFTKNIVIIEAYSTLNTRLNVQPVLAVKIIPIIAFVKRKMSSANPRRYQCVCGYSGLEPKLLLLVIVTLTQGCSNYLEVCWLWNILVHIEYTDLFFWRGSSLGEPEVYFQLVSM